MQCEPIDELDDPRVADYRNVPDPVLLRERGLFVAEGRLIVRHLLASPGVRTRSVLASPTALEALRDALDGRNDVAVFVMPVERLSALVGFNIHRGCLAIGERPAPLAVRALVDAAGAARVLVAIEQVGNADNVGGIFRNAQAFGAGGIVLSNGSCDPLYRKAIRVSMGATLRVPFAVADRWPGALRALKAAGYHVLALTPAAGARDLGEALAALLPSDRIALVLGHEGAGLGEEAILAADDCVRIPMAPGVDSLNVATAAGVALYACSQHLRGPVPTLGSDPNVRLPHERSVE